MYNRVSLKNFGAEKIFVISDAKNEKRRADFIEAWSGFSDFNFEFVDAIMASEINLDDLYRQGKLADIFYDPNGCLSKTVFAIALSHEKVWHKIWDLHEYSQNEERFLILEDDARPTKALCEDIFTGYYRKLLKKLARNKVDTFIWGKKNITIKMQELTNSYFGIPSKYHDVSGHSYMITRSVAYELVNRQKKIDRAVDVLIEDVGANGDIYAPYKSYFRQQGNILNKFVMHPEDEDFLYSSSSSRNEFIHGKLDYENTLRWIDPSVLDYIESVERITPQDHMIYLKFKELL